MTVTRWLYVVVGVGAALRLFPVWFGLPYLRARPDEETAIGHALAVLQGDPNPHFFHWPSLTFYLLAALFEIASGIRRALFSGPFLTAIERLLIARTFVAVAGALTIVVLFRLARRIADETTGLLAAVFLAVAILHVRESHFALTDVLMTLLVTVSLLLLLRARDAAAGAPAGAAALRVFAAAGLAGGLASSTKYSAAAVLAAMGAEHVVRLIGAGRTARWEVRTWTPPLVFLAAFACGFVIGTPFALLDYPVFAADLRFDFTHLSAGHVGNLSRGWSYHLARSLPYGVGIPTFVAAIAGVVPAAKHYGRSAVVVGAFAVAFYALMGSGHAVFFRYVLPLVPVLCLLAAVAVRHAGIRLAARAHVSIAAAIALLMTIVAGPALINSAWFDGLLAKTDTRVLAARWLVPQLLPEDTLHQSGGLYAELDLAGASFHRWSFDPDARSFGDPGGRSPDWLVFHESPLWTYATVPPELIEIARAKYVLAYRVDATRTLAPDSAVYDLQDAFYMPLTGWSTVVRPGPTVSIYRRADRKLVGR